MRVIILISFCLTSLFSFGQWSPISLQSNESQTMEVINKDTVLFGEDYGGRIFRYVSAGTSAPSFQTQFTTEFLIDIDFPTPNVGYACGGTYFGSHTNVIVKTLDNGVTWDSLTSNTFSGYVFTNVNFVNNDTGFVSSGGVILKTIDGGTTFYQIVVPQNTSTITKLYITPSDRVLVSTRKLLANNTYNYSLYSSDDLGISWSLRYSDSLIGANGLNHRIINDIYFLDANIGFAVGGNGLFLKTIDGGNSWSRSFINPYTNLTTVYFSSINTGYTNIAGGISKTIDGGNTWSPQNVSPPMIINQIIFANDSIGYALGNNGLYKTTNSGGTLTNIKKESIEKKITIYPNPAKEIIKIEGLNIFEITSATLVNLQGENVKHFTENLNELNISTIKTGNYFLKIITLEDVFVEKVVILR